MTYKVQDIALEIQQDLGLTDIGPGAISYWINNHLGTLNNYIYTSYDTDDVTGEITPAIGIEEISILKKMYELENHNRLIRENLGASSFSAVVEVRENGNSVKMVNTSEMGKVYSELRKQSIGELSYLINGYLQRNAGSSARSVDGVDSILPNANFYIHDGYQRG